MSIENTVAELRKVMAHGATGHGVELRHEADSRYLYNAELILELSLPQELKDLFSVANGQYRYSRDGVPAAAFLPELQLVEGEADRYCDAGYLCGVEEMLLETLIFRDELKRLKSDGWNLVDDLETIGPVALHESLLVISGSDDPSLFFLDLDPPRGGRHGQIVWLNEQPWEIVLVADGIGELLRRILDGHKKRQYRLVETGGTAIFTERNT
jgi:cell wall assembly regulator SMI1